MAEIIWTRSVLKDLSEIHEYISRDSKFYAGRHVTLLFERVDVLIDFPLAGRIVPEKDNETIRELIEGNYRIFYRVVSKNKISILRIHHAAKKIK